jgi:hypothetical protein
MNNCIVIDYGVYILSNGTLPSTFYFVLIDHKEQWKTLATTACMPQAQIPRTFAPWTPAAASIVAVSCSN